MSATRSNFGGNVTIGASRVLAPRSEAEVVAILEECAAQRTRVRALGSLHSWSTLVECPGVALDLRALRHVRVRRTEAGALVEAGAGCTIAEVLAALEREGLTLPTLGATTAQTVAGAVATATHGSGHPSLSHYVKALRIACLDGGDGAPAVLDFDDTVRADDFRAARVSLGYLGVVVSVTLEAVPQYVVEESLAMVSSLRNDVLSGAEIYPLQQFAVVPYAWRYYVFRRRVRRSPPAGSFARRVATGTYRIYKLAVVDFLLHGIVALMARSSRGRLIRLFYRRIFPAIALRHVSVVDRSDRVLTLRHDMFAHLEMEAFVPENLVEQALTLVRHLTEVFAHRGAAPLKLPDQLLLTLKAVPGALETLRERRGTFTYHYVISCRRVAPETAMLAPTSGDRSYYSLSFFTFDVARSEPFYDYFRLLASCLVTLYDARLHWGKHFPLDYERGARAMYSESRMRDFRDVCRRYDPRGLLGNRFAREMLGFEDG